MILAALADAASFVGYRNGGLSADLADKKIPRMSEGSYQSQTVMRLDFEII